MLYNEAHKELMKRVEERGWDEETAILHLTAFIVSRNLVSELREYLSVVAAEEEDDLWPE